MPQLKQQEQNDTPSARRTRFATLWHNFHFSGRVIMCSVLFGLGLILIGSLLFAINMDDDSKSKDEKFPNDMPSKPPSNVIGPVVMGIGGFIAIVGVIMCLFETQVCRKKTGDSSPLISEGPADSERNGSEPAEVPSTSCSNSKHRQGRKSASPKRSKGRRGKPHSKERNPQKSPKTPPISIATKSFMTSSEDKFLTPPNTLADHTALVHSNSRDAENQTSSSLMKSFSSSGPSWNQSTEFQTPSTSFRDTPVPLENSIEIDENQDGAHFNTTELLEKLHKNVGNMTPVILEDEKIKKMSAGIQNQKKELHDLQSKETDTYFSKTEADILPDMSNTPRSARDLENIDTKSLEFQSVNEGILKHKNIVTENISTGQLSIDHDALTTEDYQTQDVESITPVHHEGSVHNENGETIPEESFKGSLNKDTNEMPNIITSPADENNSNIEDTTVKATLIDVFSNDVSDVKDNAGDAQADLESSASSGETVVSQDRFHEKHVSSVPCEELKENLIVETENLNIAESEKVTKSAQNDVIDIHKSQSDIENEHEAGIHDDQNESNTFKENENKDKLPKDSS